MLRRLPVSIDTFDDAVGPALRRAPVLNQVELGIIDNVRADPGRYPNGVRMVAVLEVTTDEIGLAIQTPPHKPLVSVAADTVAFELGRRFADLYPETRSVFGTEHTAGAFARGAGAGDIRRTSHDGVVDNVVRRGRVVDAGTGDASVDGVRAMMERIREHPRLAAACVQTVGSKGYDGMLLAVVGADAARPSA